MKPFLEKLEAATQSENLSLSDDALICQALHTLLSRLMHSGQRLSLPLYRLKHQFLNNFKTFKVFFFWSHPAFPIEVHHHALVKLKNTQLHLIKVPHLLFSQTPPKGHRSGVFKHVFKTRCLISKQDLALYFVPHKGASVQERNDSYEKTISEISFSKRVAHKNTFLYQSEAHFFQQDVPNITLYFGHWMTGTLNERDKFKGINKDKIIEDILSGLCFLHQQNCVHQDIKPQNILIHFLPEENRWQAKLTDFGNGTTHRNQEFYPVATAGFESPEMSHYYKSDPKQRYLHRYFGRFNSLAKVYAQYHDLGKINLYQGLTSTPQRDFSIPCFANDIWACGITLFHYKHQKFPKIDTVQTSPLPILKEMLNPLRAKRHNAQQLLTAFTQYQNNHPKESTSPTLSQDLQKIALSPAPKKGLHSPH